MKKKIIECDVCGADITYDDFRYKFKMRMDTWANFEDLECTKWERLDMCEDCFNDFILFIKQARTSD